MVQTEAYRKREKKGRKGNKRNAGAESKKVYGEGGKKQQGDKRKALKRY